MQQLRPAAAKQIEYFFIRKIPQDKQKQHISLFLLDLKSSLHSDVKTQALLPLYIFWASLVACRVKNPPPMQRTQETQVRSLGREDPLEEVATHSSILAWKIPWTEEPGGLWSMGSQRARHS